MAQATLVAHCGARIVNRTELDEASRKTPMATRSWVPVAHNVLIDTVGEQLHAAGYTVRKTQYALSRHDARLFATLDLATNLYGGETTLAVALVNSVDKSLPMKMIAGTRVFICDNLSLRSDMMSAISRKHSRFGMDRFREGLSRAIVNLTQFKEAETKRIQLYQHTDVNDQQAESAILRSYEQGIISHRLLPQVISQWRNPTFDEFQPRTLWSLENGFTTVLSSVFKGSPQRFCDLSIRLQGLLAQATGLRPQETDATLSA